MTQTERRSYTDEEKTEALALYREHGAGEAARRTGIPRVNISQWARRADVTSDHPNTATQLSEGARARWDLRRATEAAEAGNTAEKLRKACVAAIKERDATLIRATSLAYEKFVNAANTLAGEPANIPTQPPTPTGQPPAGPTPQDAVNEGRRLALQLVHNPPNETP